MSEQLHEIAKSRLRDRIRDRIETPVSCAYTMRCAWCEAWMLMRSGPISMTQDPRTSLTISHGLCVDCSSRLESH